MKNILNIFKRDLKNIITNWVALVIVLAVIVLPSLYAWVNIKACWDPYSNTGGIKVAVVNRDIGGTFNDEQYNIGNQLIETLEENDSFGWQFVSNEEAERGILEGDYYASIEIPADFTEDVLSLTTSNIVRPSLIYNINEKSNSIVAKITGTGVNTLVDQINSKIVKTVNGLIFNLFDEVGVSASDYKETLRTLIDDLYTLNDRIPEIQAVVDNASDGLASLDEVIVKMQEIMPLASNTINESQSLVKEGQAKMNNVKGQAEAKNAEVLNHINSIQDSITSVQNEVKGSIGNANIAANEKLELMKRQLTDIDTKLKALEQQISGYGESGAQAAAIISSLRGKVAENLNTISEAINSSVQDIGGILKSFDNTINQYQSDVTELVNIYNNDLAPALIESYESANSIADSGTVILNKVENTIPDINYLINLASKGSNLGKEELQTVKEKLPSIQEKLNSLVEKIKEYDDGENYEKLVDLLINDSEESSSFLSKVVNIEKNSVFSVPNYGSGMSPFYSTLALWVGGTILVSLLTTHARKFEDDEEIKPYEEYFGKGLTFISIAALQGLVLTLGDIFLLNTYVLHPVLFVMIGMLISVVFVSFIYTLVSVFGNIGKALAIIFLVFQVAASGGTFPVEVMSEFFQAINPLMPFKYAIALMRETTAGIVESLMVSNLIYLLVYLVISIILGVTLKDFVNKNTKKFAKKLDESGIAGH